MVTTADRLRAKGYAEWMAAVRAGREVELEADRLAEARTQGRASMLNHLLRVKFGTLAPEVYERVNAGSFDEVHTWAVRILTATTLDEVWLDGDGDAADWRDHYRST